jgi:ADP-ribose pyrophosphatase YjhB (NUDIX family)
MIKGHQAMTRKQDLAVGLLRQDGTILMVKEAYGLRLWTLPSGYVEAGETFAQAAVRETREETGLEATVLGVVAVRERADQLVIAFALEPSSGQLLESVPGEIDAVKWFRPHEFGEVRTRVNDFAAFLVEGAFQADLPRLASGVWQGRDGGDAELYQGE